MTILLIIMTLLLITGGQILQKIAADRASILAIDKGLVYGLIHQSETWWAALCLAAGMIFWLAVLHQLEVSKAYPLLGLGYVLVLLVSRFWLRERVSLGRWFGVFLIVAGISVLSLD